MQRNVQTTADARSVVDAGKRLRKLAWLLDNSIRLPGGFRIGIDGMIGLVPGIGDLLTALLSSYIVVEAARMKVGSSVLMRMVGNIALELGIGLVPVVGDLFDFVFKANTRNLQLMETYLEQPIKTRRSSRWRVRAVLLALVLLIGAMLVVAGGILWLAAVALFGSSTGA